MPKKKIEITGKDTRSTGKELKTIVTNAPSLVYEATAADTSTITRRNRASTIERTDKYANIDAGALPFKYSVGYSGAEMDARDTIILCQKAYFNIGVVRNVIDLMTEFSVGDIYLRDGNASARDFISAWMNKIGMRAFLDRFFREYYRSGNVFVFRFDGDVQPGDVKKIVSTFGLNTAKGYTEIPVDKMRLPARYVILNPADILFAGNISFYAGIYFKRLSDYELLRLRTPKTDEDQEVVKSLPPEIRKKIQSRNIGVVNLPLDPRQVTGIFYKKQDYEPFSAPMVYPVLEDLNFKIELKRLDMAIARTQQQVILLVTTGAEPDKGGINQANIIALQKLFQNESVGRVLIADYTTEAKFVVPDIGNILTPQKYEQLDKDINIGLNNILVGGEKFANQETKVEVFLARLEHGRQTFLNDFLIPEIRRICKSVGFKSYPIPYFDEITLKNNDLRDKVYLRLTELGLLTPEESFTALETGRLPDSETLDEDQKQYKKDRDAGLYQPLLNPPKDQMAPGGGAGRPGGTKGSPQTTKKMTPIGGSETYSMTKLIEHMKAAQSLGNDVATLLCLQFKKKKLTNEQKNVAAEITKVIIANEEPEKWKEVIGTYVKEPVDKNPERIKAIHEIAAEHGCDDYLASLLYISKKPVETQE